MLVLVIDGMGGGIAAFRAAYAKYGYWIMVQGLTPIPYKLVTIASGLAAFSFPIFVVASTITRAARFFLVALVVKKFGPAMMPARPARPAPTANTMENTSCTSTPSAAAIGRSLAPARTHIPARVWTTT